MQVTITKSQLEANRACKVYLTSPEWNGEALVYADWDATVSRLLATREGMSHLDFLVVRALVPMTVEEFIALKKARNHG